MTLIVSLWILLSSISSCYIFLISSTFCRNVLLVPVIKHHKVGQEVRAVTKWMSSATSSKLMGSSAVLKQTPRNPCRWQKTRGPVPAKAHWNPAVAGPPRKWTFRLCLALAIAIKCSLDLQFACHPHNSTTQPCNFCDPRDDKIDGEWRWYPLIWWCYSTDAPRKDGMNEWSLEENWWSFHLLVETMHMLEPM